MNFSNGGTRGPQPCNRPVCQFRLSNVYGKKAVCKSLSRGALLLILRILAANYYQKARFCRDTVQRMPPLPSPNHFLMPRRQWLYFGCYQHKVLHQRKYRSRRTGCYIGRKHKAPLNSVLLQSLPSCLSVTLSVSFQNFIVSICSSLIFHVGLAACHVFLCVLYFFRDIFYSGVL